YDGKRLERQDLNPALTCKNRHSPPRGYLKNVDLETRLGHTGSGKQALLATGFSWLSGSSTNFARQLNLYRYRGANGPPGGAAELTVAAPTATTWQSLYDLYWTLAIAAGTITIGALVFFTNKYRSKAGTHTPSQADENTHPSAVSIIILIMAIILRRSAFESFQGVGHCTS